ncbi:MAG: S26 family signal peptidase, partial [Nitriliruptoraceae bacterium]
MAERDEPLFGEPSEDPDADPAEAASGEDRGASGAEEPPPSEAEATGGTGPDLLFPFVPAGGAEVPASEEGRPRRHEPARTSGSFWRELPALLVVALVLAFLLRTFVVQVFYIPSSSMEPTLSIDDRMV